MLEDSWAISLFPFALQATCQVLVALPPIRIPNVPTSLHHPFCTQASLISQQETPKASSLLATEQPGWSHENRIITLLSSTHTPLASLYIWNKIQMPSLASHHLAPAHRSDPISLPNFPPPTCSTLGCLLQAVHGTHGSLLCSLSARGNGACRSLTQTPILVAHHLNTSPP